MKNLGTDYRKLIKSKDVFLEDHIFGDVENNDEFQSSPEIPIIPTSVSPPVVPNDHRGVEEDNNDGPVEPVDQLTRHLQNHQHHQLSQN